MRWMVLGLVGFMAVTPAAAQDFTNAEVVVTGTRMAAEREEFDDYDGDRPAVGLLRTADFLVQQVVIRGDTRDPKQRAVEIRKMLNEAVSRASAAGVELAYGDFILTPLTRDNVEELTLSRDSRPDSERVVFLVKAKLSDAQSGTAAQNKIKAYIESIPENGRAEMDEWGDATFSVVGPDSYRAQIIAAIAADAKRLTAEMGDNYAVEVEGLNRTVQWARSGPSEVLLYIPYKLTVLPRP